MHPGLRTALEYLTFFLSSNLLSLGFLKYMFVKEYEYPYFAMLLASIPLGFIGFYILIKRMLQYNGDSKILYLTGQNYLILGILFTGGVLFSLGGVYQDNMGLARFLVYQYAAEIVFMPLFSFKILKRPFFGHYYGILLCAALGIVLTDVLKTDVDEKGDIKIESAEGYEGPIYTFVGKILAVLGTVLSKKFVIQRAFVYKLKDYNVHRDNNSQGNSKLKNKKTAFYQDYFEGVEKPKLLKRSSFIHRRFELFKKFREAETELLSDKYKMQKQRAEEMEKATELYDDNLSPEQIQALQKEKELKKFKQQQFENLIIKLLNQSYVPLENLSLPPEQSFLDEEYYEQYDLDIGEIQQSQLYDYQKGKKLGGLQSQEIKQNQKLNQKQIQEIKEKNRKEFLERQKNKLKAFDYGTLKQEELDQIMDLDEQFLNTLIKRQTQLKFTDLKQYELDSQLKQEADEKDLLLLFLLDYKDLKLNTHIFHGQDDMTLTKLDEIFDSILYDSELLHCSNINTVEIYGICHIFLMFGAMFMSYYNLEWYESLYQYIDDDSLEQKSFFDNKYCLFIILVSFLMIFKPFIQTQLTLKHQINEYFLVRLFNDFLALAILTIFTENSQGIKSTTLFGLCLVYFGQFLIYLGSSHQQRWAEFQSYIELAKTFFSQTLDPIQLVHLEIRLVQIHHVLGKKEFLRILIDLFSSCNPRQVLHTANPVLNVRKQFDPHFNQRTKNWGGAYPRPLVEQQEKSWVSNDQSDVWISALSQVQGDYQKILLQQKREQKKEKEQEDIQFLKKKGQGNPKVPNLLKDLEEVEDDSQQMQTVGEDDNNKQNLVNYKKSIKLD
ncbi:hypothetical protein PPERSA_04569 [Pseudocohnilembus persalinus]|uniref:Uncharacterized protein n=1 Tax=Pseudocohnilembus persalinus TaxID=266149 RepID=A0A0V0QED8_PSEPJ|nr:hypothetical protein PPERSA_04569 [Pseudocohnilembus persalinus]|eukprot:KRX00548.1 hypothetical protein PPERSA_04569 [Pseudocohnilembus persalinus]